MARTKGSKNKAKEPPIYEETPSSQPDPVVRVASTEQVSNPKQKALLEQIKQLQEENARLEGAVKQSATEIKALRDMEQGSMFGSAATEKPTGKTVMVKALKRYKVVGWENGREVLRPEFHQVPVETWLIRIDMPPCGDVALKINDVPFYHGAIYEVDTNTLRTLKDIVWRTWQHDKEIHGDKNENAYRRRQVDYNPRNVIRGGGQ